MGDDEEQMPSVHHAINGTTVVVYALGAAVLFVAAVAVAAVYLRRKRKLTWFEKSVLEISKGDPEVIHYGRGDSENAFDEDETSGGWVAYDHRKNKKDGGVNNNRTVSWGDGDGTENSNASRLKTISTHRRQSRIVYLSPSDLEALGSSSSVSTGSSPMGLHPSKDVSKDFYVPKSRDNTSSMFRGLDMSKIDRGLYDTRQDSILKQEQILGLCGSLNMGLGFDPFASLLTVKLIQAANLVARRTDDTPPNPYFKVHLIPSELSANNEPQIFESKRYESTRSMLLTDEFQFNIPNGNIRNCQLEVTVYDADESASDDECIGCCWLSLNRIDITEEPDSKTIFWAEILPLEAGDEESAGEICFSTSYSAKTQRLTVNIIKARNLLNTGVTTEPPDPCVKVTIYAKQKKLKQRRTGTKKSTYHPSFNENLTFNIPKSTLCDLVLSLVVTHEGGAFRQGKQLGKLDIPLHKCKDLWRALIRDEDSKAIWYELEKC